MGNEVATPSAGKLAKKAMAALSPQLADIRDKVQKRQAGVRKDDIMSRWDIGSLVADVPEDTAKYGENAVERLATSLGLDAQELYRNITFSQTFQKKELAELLDKRTSVGTAICWSHLNEVCRLPSEAARNKLISKIFSQALSVREVIAEVQKVMGGKRGNNAAGRPRKGIKTPMGALQLLIKQAGLDCNLLVDADQQVELVLGSPAEYASAEMVTEISEACAQVKTVAAAYAEMAAKLEAAESAASRSLRFAANQSEAQAEEDARAKDAAEDATEEVEAPKPKLKLKAGK